MTLVKRTSEYAICTTLPYIISHRLGRWLVNRHGAQWRGLGDTQRQDWEFISGPRLGTGAKLMTFNRIQSRVVTGRLTGHNTLRRHLYLLGLLDSPLCWKCRVWEETSAHIVSARLWPHSDMHTWPPFSWSRGILGV